MHKASLISRTNNELILSTIFLYALMVFSDITPLIAARILTILLAQIFTGGEIYRFFKKSDSLSLIEYAAFGFALGSMTWLISDQIFIVMSLPKIGWVIPFAASALSRFVLRNQKPPKLIANWRTLRWISIATLLGLSGEWVWTLPFAIFVTALLFMWDSSILNLRDNQKSAIFAVLITLAASVTMVLRPKIWWISQGDTHFYEGLTKSVAKWGWQESTFSSGFSLQYHWFPYAWSGLVTRLSDSPDWVVLTRVGVLVPALCLVSFVWTISTRLSSSKMTPIAGVLLFCASSVFGEWFVITPLAMLGSFSQLFATIWLLPVVLWVIDADNKSFSKSWLYLGLLFVGLVGGKVSHAAIAASFLLSFQVFRVWRTRSLLKSAMIESFTVLSAMLITSRLLFGSGGSLSLRPAAWASYLQGDLYEFYGRALWLAAAILALGMIFLAVNTLIFGFSILHQYPALNFGLVVAFFSGLLFSNLSSGPTSPNGLFFLHASVMLVYSVLGVVVVGLWDRGEKFKTSEIIICVAFAVLALLTIYLIPNRNSGANSAIWLRTSRSLVVLIPLILILGYFKLKKSHGYLIRVSKGILLASATMSVAVFIATNASSYMRDMNGFNTNGKLFLPSEDLIELRDWFGRNSFETDIYASNYVCEGEDCAAPQLSQRALLSTTIERRALIESPWIASAFTEPRFRDGTQNFSNRLKYSAEFANMPTSQIVKFFELSSVRWYIVDLDRTNNGRWKFDSAAVFTNESYVLVDLEKFGL